jgi:hypothetical protein
MILMMPHHQQMDPEAKDNKHKEQLAAPGAEKWQGKDEQ